MRALTAATGVKNIFGFTLSSLPSSIVDVVAAGADDPTTRKAAIDFAKVASEQFGLPGQFREAFGALLDPYLEDTKTRNNLQMGLLAEPPVSAVQAGLMPGSPAAPVSPLVPAARGLTPPPSKAIADAVGQRIINERATADSYTDRLRAYIPIEVLSVFITVNSTLGNSLSSIKFSQISLQPPMLHSWVSVALLVLSIVSIIAYTRRTGIKAHTVWGMQALISTIAFLVWTYAMKASFYMAFGVGFDPAVSALCLGGFTLASGFVVPTGKPGTTNQ